VKSFQLGTINHQETCQYEEYGIPQELAPAEIIGLRITDSYLEQLPESLKDEIVELERQGNAHACYGVAKKAIGAARQIRPTMMKTENSLRKKRLGRSNF